MGLKGLAVEGMYAMIARGAERPCCRDNMQGLAIGEFTHSLH